MASSPVRRSWTMSSPPGLQAGSPQQGSAGPGSGPTHWCPVVAPRKPPQAPCSSQAATQPAASEPGPSTTPPAKRSKCTKAEQAAELTQPIKGKGNAQGKAAKGKPAPQPGRWLDRDCNAALNMQRVGESRWRLELCWWPEQAPLPAKGKDPTKLIQQGTTCWTVGNLTHLLQTCCNIPGRTLDDYQPHTGGTLSWG
ncbi:hypothetical protein HaLaN_27636 [Haematococcus lacustris]|uniref:Uncharacterized protein n=1 Tax=Haematococcus lacustris TaxID=44745 RepID=A0A6A0AAB8_HAELA|nr:hypothetical protein HaLaN_27636 [Haematococcus lacustris]